MNKILLENNLDFNFPQKIYKNFNTLNTEQEKRNLLTDPEFKRKYLKGIPPEMFEIIYRSIINDGIDIKTNKFLKYLSVFDKKIFKGNENKFKYIFDAVTNNKIDLNQYYLKNNSLFDRDFEDFKYTMNAFELVHNKNKLKKLFYDTSQISDHEFYDGDIIKDAGVKNKSDNTIYSTIDNWLSNGNEKNTGLDSDDDKNLIDIIKNKNFNYNFFENLILMNFDDLIEKVKTNYSSSFSGVTISSILYPYYIGLKLKEIVDNLHDDVKIDFSPTKHGAIENAKSGNKSKNNIAYPGSVITYPVKDKKDNKLYYKTSLYYIGYFDDNFEDEIPLELEQHRDITSKLYRANMSWSIKVLNFLKKVKINIPQDMDKEEQIAYCAIIASIKCWDNDLMVSDSYNMLK